MAIAVPVVALFFVYGRDRLANREKPDGKPTVVASFYPLYYFASQIAGDQMDVINIGEGSDPHDFTPSSKDITLMHKADLVLLQGAGLEPWGEGTARQLEAKGIPVFVATEHLQLRKVDSRDDGREEQAGSYGDLHHHGGYDPHTWLDPVLAKETVIHIADEFVKLDPEHEEYYRHNAQSLANDLEALDKTYAQQLAYDNCSVHSSMVSHDAFGYLSERYDLRMHPIAGLSTLDKPSADLLAQLAKLAQDEKMIAILTEGNSVKEYAETIADETGLALIPINSLAVSTEDGDYIDGMYRNLDNLKKAYDCETR